MLDYKMDLTLQKDLKAWFLVTIMKNNLLIFLKGFLMGICDLIPGISGGTIAFITGIYGRLINAVRGFSFETFRTRDFKKLDLGFLIVLFLGIAFAILLGSRIVKFLLEDYFVFTLAFFIGLILGSSKIIFNHIKNHKTNNMLFGLFGLVVGIVLSFLVPLEVSPSLGYVFFGGFVGISAMFLPGISGAFILLIMGLYEFIIGVLHEPFGNVEYLFVFLVGAVLGAMFISRIVSFLFKTDKCKTLYFLLGLVVGALSIPIKRIVGFGGLGVVDWIIIVGYFVLGLIVVFLLNSFDKGVFEN